MRDNLAIIVGHAETLKGAGEQVGVGTVGSVGSNLLVVKERDETNVGVVGQRVGVLQTSDQGLKKCAEENINERSATDPHRQRSRTVEIGWLTSTEQ